ncbi:CHAT domain-containing protein [Tolypothrix sp. FACHB-123]|uniref:CHAT domain-containing protein n=1 Tax=Tolypothrix sp. FACHB-123 TaxID=2692868 RepID=UPI0016894106|nr:CHAT domain-containing protein [Tolypothrix sp. FACHB-123]MBD2357061.1 CHAT domain-containing protein [Tolypothrix sp. FACHB-123]
MKLRRSFLVTVLSVALVLILFTSVNAQNRNQSDVTGPIPEEPNITEPTTTGGGGIEIDRTIFDRNFESAPVDQAVEQFEELQAVEIGERYGTSFYGDVASTKEIADTLRNLCQQTGQNAALLYVTSLQDKLDLILILPSGATQSSASNSKCLNSATANLEPIRKNIPEAKHSLVQKTAQDFRQKITNFRNEKNRYLVPSQQLYQWIVAPFETTLQANKINTLIFSMDSGLRSLPIAALNDGKQFIIEKYSVALIPSFSLTDTRFAPIAQSQVLAIGVSESTEDQVPLPFAGVEISTLTNQIWRGQSQSLLNNTSTIENLKSVSSKQKFGIIHLATHGQFNPGELSQSYIQLWNEKIRLNQLRSLSQELKWSAEPKVEMLVLSACTTALGNDEAELGFAGLAVQAGVKTALGSLWYVSDEGSLALMTKFYDELKTKSLRSLALREAQLGMLKGEVRIQDGKLRLAENNIVPLPPEIDAPENLTLSHPYFWSAFTVVGNWN